MHKNLQQGLAESTEEGKAVRTLITNIYKGI